KTLHALLVGRDRSLEDEFRAALAGVADVHGVVYVADTYRQALDTARGRQPNFIVIDVDRDVGEIAALCRDLHDVLPAAALAGAYKLDGFEPGQSETSAIIELVRAHVRDFLRRPLSATELRSVLDRLSARLAPPAPSERGRIVSLVSNKGGVGKSTLAVNVAC